MDSLPDELILQIYKTVLTHPWKGGVGRFRNCRERNLHRLSLVSRRFNRIFTPLLYEKIRDSMLRDCPSWKQLVDALYQNPTLSQYIKTFSMTKCDQPFGNDLQGSVRSDLPLALLPRLNCYGRVSDLALDLEDRFQDRDFVLATFIIMQAPLLEKLKLRGFGNVRICRYPTRLPLAVEEMGRSVYKDMDACITPRCFANLRVLEIDLANWHYFPPKAVIPFLYLTQLKSLSLRNWGSQSKSRRKSGFKHFGREREWPMRSSSVETLRLRDVHASFIHVASLVLACKELKNFECTGVRMNRGPCELVRVEPWFESVNCALLKHARTLITIIVDKPMEPKRFRIGPLQLLTPHLTSLKTLQIPYSLLAGFDQANQIAEYLPPSLEHLVLLFVHRDIMEDWEYIEPLITRTSESICNSYLAGLLPHLRGVELILDLRSFAHPELRHPHADIRNIISCLASHHVKFGLSMTAEYKDTNIDVYPPTVDEMRALNEVFPGFVVWDKFHRKLKASTSRVPCVELNQHLVHTVLPIFGPYGEVVAPWDFENERITVGSYTFGPGGGGG